MQLNRRSRLPGEAGPPHPEASRPLSGRPLKCRWVGADTEAPATSCALTPRPRFHLPTGRRPILPLHHSSHTAFPETESWIHSPFPANSWVPSTLLQALPSASVVFSHPRHSHTHSTNAQEHVTFAEMRMTLNSEGCWPSSSKKEVKIDSVTLKVSS